MKEASNPERDENRSFLMKEAKQMMKELKIEASQVVIIKLAIRIGGRRAANPEDDDMYRRKKSKNRQGDRPRICNLKIEETIGGNEREKATKSTRDKPKPRPLTRGYKKERENIEQGKSKHSLGDPGD